jgi:hypothetical protein
MLLSDFVIEKTSPRAEFAFGMRKKRKDAGAKRGSKRPPTLAGHLGKGALIGAGLGAATGGLTGGGVSYKIAREMGASKAQAALAGAAGGIVGGLRGAVGGGIQGTALGAATYGVKKLAARRKKK